MPSASARRRAGSTVSTSTRPPRWVAAVAAMRRGRGRLADSARAAHEHHLLGGQHRVEARCTVAAGISALPMSAVADLTSERLGEERDHAPAARPRVQLRDDDRVEVGGQAVAEPFEVAGADLGPTFGDPGRLDHGPHRPTGGLDEHRLDARRPCRAVRTRRADGRRTRRAAPGWRRSRWRRHRSRARGDRRGRASR